MHTLLQAVTDGTGPLLQTLTQGPLEYTGKLQETMSPLLRTELHIRMLFRGEIFTHSNSSVYQLYF